MAQLLVIALSLLMLVPSALANGGNAGNGQAEEVYLDDGEETEPKNEESASRAQPEPSEAERHPTAARRPHKTKGDSKYR